MESNDKNTTNINDTRYPEPNTDIKTNDFSSIMNHLQSNDNNQKYINLIKLVIIITNHIMLNDMYPIYLEQHLLSNLHFI